MKYALILIISLGFGTQCLGQSPFYGSFTQGESPFFRVPINSKAELTTGYNYASSTHEFYVPAPIFICDSNVTIRITSGSGGEFYGSDNLLIIITCDTPRCLPLPGYGFPPESSISAYLDSTSAGFYVIYGVFYDPKVIGKVTGPDSLYCGSIPYETSTNVRLTIRNDSLARYRQIKTLSVDEPFSLDDTIEMMYPCEEYVNTPNCYFHPMKAGHFVDTAKLLDELTNDTTSVVLIGDAYDAGVNSVPKQQVKLYPNPCDRELQIAIPSDETAQIEIYNLFGERVYNSNTQGNDATIDCSQFTAGVYFISIDGMTLRQIQKLIVAH